MFESDSCQGRQKGKKCFTVQDTHKQGSRKSLGKEEGGVLGRQSNCKDMSNVGTVSAGA